MLGDVEVEDTAAVVGEHDQDEKDAEPRRAHVRQGGVQRLESAHGERSGAPCGPLEYFHTPPTGAGGGTATALG